MGLRRILHSTPLEPVTWAWEGLAPRGFLSMVGSLPGEGKSTLLTRLALHATAGAPLLERAVAKNTVVYVDFDSPTGDGRAVRGWLERHREAVAGADLEGVVLLEPEGSTYGLAEPEMKQLEATVREVGAGLVIIDSFMAAFPVDPVKLHLVQSPLWHLRRLAMETGAAVVLIDHLPKPLAGEKAGARGLIGSVAKPAQSRSVLLLTRVPPREVAGRHVLRVEQVKNSFAPLAEPFGVELNFTPPLSIEVVALPEGYGDTKLEKAIRAIQDALEAHQGQVVARTELLRVAVATANVGESTAKKALQEAVTHLGAVAVELPGEGRGRPAVGYRLPEVEGSNQNNQKSENPVQDGAIFGQNPLTKNPGVTKNPPDPSRLSEQEALAWAWGRLESLPNEDERLRWRRLLNREGAKAAYELLGVIYGW